MDSRVGGKASQLAHNQPKVDAISTPATFSTVKKSDELAVGVRRVHRTENPRFVRGLAWKAGVVR